MTIAQTGSPPQVRGKLYKILAAATVRGITPAGAGKTLQRLVRRVAERDHPRRCGENLLGLQQIRRHQGSPPQVRGKRHCNIGYDILPRITPAHAGKTVATATAHDNKWDHPRACGENLCPWLSASL